MPPLTPVSVLGLQAFIHLSRRPELVPLPPLDLPRPQGPRLEAEGEAGSAWRGSRLLLVRGQG